MRSSDTVPNYQIHFKSGERVRLEVADGGTLQFEGDIARFAEADKTVFAVHMRDVAYIRSDEARLRRMQPGDHDD